MSFASPAALQPHDRLQWAEGKVRERNGGRGATLGSEPRSSTRLRQSQYLTRHRERTDCVLPFSPQGDVFTPSPPSQAFTPQITWDFKCTRVCVLPWAQVRGKDVTSTYMRKVWMFTFRYCNQLF